MAVNGGAMRMTRPTNRRAAAPLRRPSALSPCGCPTSPDGERRTAALPVRALRGERGLPELAAFLPNACDRFPRRLGHQPTIVGYRGQAEAHPDHARRIGRLAAMDARVNSTLAARCEQ